ncbi:MAG TPA: transposase [Candidatus Woesebacteria bacterium]|nr:transposase [Candidatus Woesebacteria bacterium]
MQTGIVYGQTFARNRSVEFLEFLVYLDSVIEKSKIILIIADNYVTHQSKKLLKGLKKYPGRFEFAFIPTHSSWMNPIEGTFSKLQRGYLRNLRANDVPDLQTHIFKAIEEMNESPRAPNWDKFISSYFNK